MGAQIAGLQYILNGYQMRQLLSLPTDSARTDWINRFWRSQDPTPTTPRNEMRIEHDIRVHLAHQFFHIKKWPGWDRRGEVFIRYGPPNVRARIPAEVTVRKVHAPGELWYYARHAMVVVFRDESLTGNYVYAVNALGAIEDMSPDLAEYLVYDADNELQNTIPPEFLEFYRAPEIDPDVPNDFGTVREMLRGPMPKRVIRPRMRGVTERIDKTVDPDAERVTPKNPATIFHMADAEKLANRFEATLEDTPASYPFNFAKNRYPFFFGIDQFKGGSNLNRVEVNLELPVAPRGKNEVGDTRIFHATAVVFDADYKEVKRSRREIVVPVFGGNNKSDDGAKETRLIPAQLLFSLPRSYYRMAVTVSETMRERRQKGDSTAAPYRHRESSYRTTVSWKPFTAGLSISDILFATRIAPAKGLSPFARGAVEVIPHPVRRYRQGNSLPVYFEVYNLGIDESGLSEYEIEYRIIPHSTGRKRIWDRFHDAPTVVSSRFKGSGYNADEPLHMTIDTRNLKPASYDFLVSVKDIYRQTTTYRQATFRIVR